MRVRTKPFWCVLVIIVIVLNCLLRGHTAQNYVPLNSLTISNLYKKNSTSSTERPVEKLWWTDLQEKREEYKANRKKMREKLKQQQQKKPNNDRPTTLASSLLSNFVTEVPQPLSQGSTVAVKEMAQSVPYPSGTYFSILNQDLRMKLSISINMLGCRIHGTLFQTYQSDYSKGYQAFTVEKNNYAKARPNIYFVHNDHSETRNHENAKTSTINNHNHFKVYFEAGRILNNTENLANLCVCSDFYKLKTARDIFNRKPVETSKYHQHFFERTWGTIYESSF